MVCKASSFWDSFCYVTQCIRGLPNGGAEQRKLLQKTLLEILKSIADKPADDQYNILDQKIHEWRGDTPQVDDMTLVGIRV